MRCRPDRPGRDGPEGREGRDPRDGLLARDTRLTPLADAAPRPIIAGAT